MNEGQIIKHLNAVMACKHSRKQLTLKQIYKQALAQCGEAAF